MLTHGLHSRRLIVSSPLLSTTPPVYMLVLIRGLHSRTCCCVQAYTDHQSILHAKEGIVPTSSTLKRHVHAKEGAESPYYAMIMLKEELDHALVANQLCALKIA